MEGQQEANTNARSYLKMSNVIEALWRKFEPLNVVEKQDLKSRACEISYQCAHRLKK